jgi:hypothetical protein
MLFHPGFSWGAALSSSPEITSPGWVLLAVAFLQVWSYPLHDPGDDGSWLFSRQKRHPQII